MVLAKHAAEADAEIMNAEIRRKRRNAWSAEAVSFFFKGAEREAAEALSEYELISLLYDKLQPEGPRLVGYDALKFFMTTYIDAVTVTPRVDAASVSSTTGQPTKPAQPNTAPGRIEDTFKTPSF